MTKIEQADAISFLLITEFVSGAVFYGLVVAATYLVLKALAKYIEGTLG